MKRIAAVMLGGTLVACQTQDLPGPSGEAAAPQLLAASVRGSGPEQVVPGRILLKVRDGVRAEDVAGPHGLTVAGRGYGNAFLVLRGAAAGSERALAAQLRADARVVYADPDYLRQPTVDSRLWAFFNPGNLNIYYTSGPNSGSAVSSFTSVSDADEDNVDNYAAGGAKVVIGSIDTGVDFLHPEFLAGHLIKGWDWYSGDADPTDENGHGTHTTGTMVGQTVGIAGVSGAAANVSVYVQRVCGQRGCPSSAIASAIRAATDDGVVAMNLSLGGSSESQAEKDAISYATSHNALVIASAGNDGTGTVSCPACDPNAISVAASNWQDQPTYYTNWGPGLDITAPGGQMYSNTTEQGGIYSAYPGGGYRYMQGTSMAAPQVTGAAAVVASVTGLRGADLRTRLLSTADDRGAAGYDTQFGCGRLNVYRAVTGSTPAGEPAGGSVVTSPECGGTSGGGGGGGGGTTLTASFTYSCSNASCAFDGTSSTGATGWSWNFGDGRTGTGSTTTHAYAAAGTYNVVLTADNGGASATAAKTITCSVARNARLRCK